LRPLETPGEAPPAERQAPLPGFDKI
jgi:hypothetical protein